MEHLKVNEHTKCTVIIADPQPELKQYHYLNVDDETVMVPCPGSDDCTICMAAKLGFKQDKNKIARKLWPAKRYAWHVVIEKESSDTEFIWESGKAVHDAFVTLMTDPIMDRVDELELRFKFDIFKKHGWPCYDNCMFIIKVRADDAPSGCPKAQYQNAYIPVGYLHQIARDPFAEIELDRVLYVPS